MLEYASKAYDRNQKLYGHPSPYREHFQKGGEDAIKIIGGSIAAIYGVSIGTTQGVSFLVRSRALSIARQIVKSPVLNIDKFNVGATLGDFAAQFLTNGQDINKVNLLSVAGQLTIGGKVFLSSVAASGIGSFTSFTLENFKSNKNGHYGFDFADLTSSSTWYNFSFGVIGNVGAGAIGGQFAKAYQPNVFDQGVMDAGLNTYFGIGATLSSDIIDEKK
ncbi:hypothetical protein [Emticicia sp. 21SJ11W-3]|uniref:hypothetical protein n=1 Tax=Emticicia sp. 21SJ11W-3 TaxID=2916755 RepID=UPI0020A00BA4|nr:hypothetical protein [Emticicia sp. 21SJ11W-3]UTA68700.1 hypothetical protein MB380_02585 [Emticicia sp. 21SJ11W-3]